MGKDKIGASNTKHQQSKDDREFALSDNNTEIIEHYTDTITDNTEDEHIVNLRHANRNTDRNSGLNIKSAKTKSETFTTEMHALVAEELPGTLTKENFTALANFKSACSVSVYLPQSGSPFNEKADMALLKNALQSVSELLRNKGKDEAFISNLLAPVYELLKVWPSSGKQSHGLAIFIADDYVKYMRLPKEPVEKIFINSSFYISPLVPLMLTNKEHFYVLAISKKNPKIYRANAYGMEYINVPGLPFGVDDVVHTEDTDADTLSPNGGAGAGFHGAGGNKPDEKKEIAAYLHEVDETLWKEFLHSESVPLLLAGVEYLIPIYKQVSKYKHICDEVLTGNHQYDQTNALYLQARQKMEHYFNQRQRKALENYANHLASPLTSTLELNVIPAAHYGQVSNLFVVNGEHLWGTFDEALNELAIHETQEEGDEDLLDKAVIKTILNGGEVHCIDRELMPEGSKVAALLRY